jgi:hypothetical protein
MSTRVQLNRVCVHFYECLLEYGRGTTQSVMGITAPFPAVPTAYTHRLSYESTDAQTAVFCVFLSHGAGDTRIQDVVLAAAAQSDRDTADFVEPWTPRIEFEFSPNHSNGLTRLIKRSS